MTAAKRFFSVFMKSTFAITGIASGTVIYLLCRDNSHCFLSSNDSRMPNIQFRLLVPSTRAQCYEKLLRASVIKGDIVSMPLDVLIIGGGATGTGVAVDLVTRSYLEGEESKTPLKVGLVEAEDFASETSSRSSKLIHGGVRYLEKAVFNLAPMQMNLVFEALRERSIMLHQAPHLTSVCPTMIPCYNYKDVVMFWCGMKIYDLLAAAGRGTLGGVSKFMSPTTTMKHYPILKDKRNEQKLLGSVLYYDAQQNDARMCMTLALSAVCMGAAVVNHCKVTSIKVPRSITEKGVPQKMGALLVPIDVEFCPKSELVEVELTDGLTGEKKTIYTKTVVNASGPFSDHIQKYIDPKRPDIIHPSSGTHITLPEKYGPRNQEAMLVPSSDNRVLFVINWLKHTIVGTTDTLCSVGCAPKPPAKDVQWILDSLEPYTGKVDPNDVLSAWCGIRPLADPPVTDDNVKSGKSTQNIVREHYIITDAPQRMVSITGGKWTTYRKMSEDCVNKCLDAGLIDRNRLKNVKSISGDIVMFGGEKFDFMKEVLTPLTTHVDKEMLGSWFENYGDQTVEMLKVARELSGIKNGEPLNYKKLPRLCPSLPYTDADIIYSCRWEHAQTMCDVLARRCRIMFLNEKEVTDLVIDHVANLMAKELNWNRGRITKEKTATKEYLKTFKATA